jgi:hypothetical protein
MGDVSTLFRPVGLFEAELIVQCGCAAFPPRLPEQPIFYPVLNESYAIEIAECWNTKDSASGFCGFVTAFEVDSDILSRYPGEIVGNSSHAEMWVPAEHLEEFNKRIRGKIRFLRAFYGKEFSGSVPDWAAGIRER